MTGHLEHIWLKRARRGVMDAVDSAELVENQGLAGSANFGAYRQVTIITLERWLDLAAELGTDLDPAARRADLLISGIDLEGSRGRLLAIGDCLIKIGGETRPCERMEHAARGLQSAMSLRWGGGAWGAVVRGGRIQLRDPVSWHAELFD